MVGLEILIRDMQDSDWVHVREIFQQGIDSENATFERFPPEWNDWDKKYHKICRFVAVDIEKNKVVGWIAIMPISSREVFRGVAELSIYISSDYKGIGIGKLLMSKLIEESEKFGFWTLQSGIFLENVASIKLHEKFGFRLVGIREKIGQMKNGEWRDVALLERRSKIVGV